MRGVAGTWNGKHGYHHDRRITKREEGMCFSCQRRPREATIRCEPCRRKHNAKAREATKRRQQLRRVADIWEELDDGDASQPTERLFALVCDQASSELGREVDDGDVADALACRTAARRLSVLRRAKVPPLPSDYQKILDAYGLLSREKIRLLEQRDAVLARAQAILTLAESHVDEPREDGVTSDFSSIAIEAMGVFETLGEVPKR